MTSQSSKEVEYRHEIGYVSISMQIFFALDALQVTS
jgi:hypothetical protein